MKTRLISEENLISVEYIVKVGRRSVNRFVRKMPVEENQERLIQLCCVLLAR